MKIYDGLQITTPLPDIEKMVLREAVRFLNSVVPSTIPSMQKDIANGLGAPFVNSDWGESLKTTGELRAEFGLTQSQALAALDAIVNAIANSVKVKFNKFTLSGLTVNGGIEVYAIKDDMSEFLSLQEGHVTTKKGQDLHWLEWLLIEGDKIIVSDYSIVTSAGYVGGSRSGLAIMVNSKGGIWRVPPQYSGTVASNWITRVVDDYNVYFESLIAGAIKFNLDKVL